jgi:hypothetical protein
MTIPWPNGNVVAGSVRGAIGIDNKPATPAEVAEAHVRRAKILFGTMALLLAGTLIQGTVAVSIFARGDNPLIGESFSNALILAVLIGFCVGVTAYFWLALPSLVFFDADRDIKLARLEPRQVNPLFLLCGIPIFSVLVVAIGYFGLIWLQDHDRVPSAVGAMVLSMMYLAIAYSLGGTAFSHYTRAKEIRAAL